jgi:predicted alpha-1,6-mannanase (GH76 family)
MVNGGIAARALFYMSTRLNERADSATYASQGVDAVKALQSWYNQPSGLWDTTGWWNAGNCLTVLADFASLNARDANTLNLAGVFSNTFANAQKTTQIASKVLSDSFMITSNYARLSTRDEFSAQGFGGFINDFLDDEGWWALGLIRAYDVTKDTGYLNMAEHIFEDMKNFTDNTCGGGIWWSKERKYKNAIANELYLSVAASLANRAANKNYYLDVARKEWAWFKGSGMINGQGLINDGLQINADGSCTNNGGNAWTYNQGVVLGGLVELSRATGDGSLLGEASRIAEAAVRSLSRDGILHEVCDSEAQGCGADGAQFKGIFMRNLGYLQRAQPQEAFRAFILLNADSIWSKARDGQNRLGLNWAGPPGAGGGPTAGTHSSAMDAIVAAMAVA